MTEPRTEAALAGFFDDAAVFPPGLAPLDRAVRDHLARRSTALDALVGPLVLPLADARRAADLAGTGAPASSAEPLRLSLVVPAGQLEEALAFAAGPPPCVEVAALEVKTGADRAQWEPELRAAAAAVNRPAIFVELTAAQIDDGALDLLSGTGLRLKFRTGGLEAHLFPTSDELARVLEAAVAAGVPFKLTAGLHQAVRHTNNATGRTHHGFLNIANATGLAMSGADRATVRDALEDTGDAENTDRYRGISPGWRAFFTSFGTCSVAEPAESLRDLGLLPVSILEHHQEQA